MADPLIPLAAMAERAGEPLRRLREWCATGLLDCEQDGRDWLIDPSQADRVAELAAAREQRTSTKKALGLAVPAEVAPPDLGDEVATRLRMPRSKLVLSRLAIDGRDYVLAVWPDGDGLGGLTEVAELADALGGELLDGLASDG